MKKVIIIIALAAIVTEAAIAGTITGVVTSDSNGLPISGMWVYAQKYDTGEYCGGGSTNSDGFYSISGLATGTYRVRVSTGDTNYVEEYYNDALDYEDAAPVAVPSSGVVPNVNFGLAEGGTVRGTVTDSNGQPIPNMQINVIDYQMHRWRGGSQSNANGDYEIRKIPAGTYRIENDPRQSNYVRQCYDHQRHWIDATPVVISAGDTIENVDFQLSLGGSIVGTVTDANGLPIGNIQVTAQEYDNREYGYGSSTDSNGCYEIKGLLSGRYSVVAFCEGTSYASECYNNQIRWDQATPVNVSAGQQTTGIDFSLELGASISGVVKNLSGVGQANIQVNCGADNGYGTGTQTEANGFYKCDGLPVGYNYNVIAYPPPDSNYMITRITVDVNRPDEYTDNDIELGDGGLKISGKVTDKATTLPLADVRVGYWCEDFEIGIGTRTDVNGMYLLTNLPPGYVQIRAEPESYYVCIGTEFELEGDINNLNFALPAGAILCGKVLDAKTAEPLAGVEIEYWSGRYAVNRNLSTDADGTFCLTQLPPGIGEVKAKPDVESGYSWNLPWGSDWVCLNEGENRSGQIIALEKGALVRGYIKDANGNAISGIEYDYSGRDCDGWDDADDINGFYEIRLPVGIYAITSDNTDEFGALPAIVTITDVNKDVNVPDMIVYTEGNGGQISGEVNNPGGYTKTGYFLIIAFKAGTAINDPNKWYTIQPVVEAEMENAGPFSLNKLPPDVNYDIYFCVESETPDEIMSIAVRDSALNVAGGTNGVKLEYSSQGSTAKGSVKNTDDRAVLGATALLSDSSGSFGGFGETDCNGEYVIYNVPAGTYTATAVHSKYLNTSTTVAVVDGIPANVNTIIMPFAGEKEGPDLNGDGNVDMADVAEFAQQWLDSGGCEADFNQDNKVNFSDWARMAENWLSKAIWY
jgi:hypothetical protein